MKPTGPDRRVQCFWISSLLLAAFVLRCWYGAGGLDSTRFWDEQYALDNVRSLIVLDTFEPARSYYPSPVFNAPAAALVAALERAHERTGNERLDALDGGAFLPPTYLALRWWQALYGTLSVGLLFLLGRRLFGPLAGGLGAAILAFMPWQIHASGIFKPDALLVFAVLCTLYATVRTLESGSWRWAVATGLAIALAAGAKLTGVLVAVPLAFGVLCVGQRRRWLALTVAAGTSAVAFIASNPYWTRYLAYLDVLKQDYAMRAGFEGWNQLDVARMAIQLFADRWVHGTALALVAALVFVALTLSWALGFRRAGGSEEGRVRRGAIGGLLIFPAVYVVAYISQTTYFKPNNMLPLMPLTSLWIGVGLAWIWSAARTLLPVPARRPLGILALGALMAHLVINGGGYVYRQCVPHTLDAAQRFISPPSRTERRQFVWTEEVVMPEPDWHASKPLRGAMPAVPRVDAIAMRRLDRADGVIFHGERLKQPGARFHATLMAAVKRRDLVVFVPAWFRLRGPALVAVRHYRDRRAAGPIDLRPCPGLEDCWRSRFEVSEGTAPQTVSLDIWLPLLPQREMPTPELSVGGRRVELYVGSSRPDSRTFVTERLSLRSGQRSLRLVIPDSRTLDRGREVAASWITWSAGER